MLRFLLTDPELILRPFHQSRLEYTPETIAKISVPELSIVFDPSSECSIVPFGQVLNSGSAGSMDSPTFDCSRDSLHGFLRCAGHAFTIQLTFEVLQGP